MGAALAAKTLGSPAPAQASHKGPVYLGDYNNAGSDRTAIEQGAAQPTFLARNTFSQGFGRRAIGVQGETFSQTPFSAGVYGIATHLNGSGYGVRGVAIGHDGTGVDGVAVGAAGTGVSGRSDSATGVRGSGKVAGVWGTVPAGAQSGVGVLADNIEGGVALRARGDVEVRVPGNPATTSFRVDVTDPPAGQTAILVRRNVGGTLSLQRVSVGAANSGGTGFRVLRVPN